MTLVLSAATPGFVIQAADRLLTKTVRNQTRASDPIANKTIVYRATDALVAISYSGVAYVRSQPTDEWLAELLWGAPIARGPDGNGPPAFGFAARPNAWTIDRAIDALRRAVDGQPQSWITVPGYWPRRSSTLRSLPLDAPNWISMACRSSWRRLLVTRGSWRSDSRSNGPSHDWFAGDKGRAVERGVVGGCRTCVD
ncbi:MAG: hypothetical protein JSR72_01525 [Proteobacteria bacterium]|nr:hypothetical protein [Pseudomonadota bacterium]